MTNKQVFSVGDVVRCVCDASMYHNHEGAITAVRAGAHGTIFDVDGSGPAGWYATNLELVRPASPAEPAKGGWVPKVGERVRHKVTGDVGVLLVADGRNSRARWDRTQVSIGCWLENLEPAPAPADAREDVIVDGKPARAEQNAHGGQDGVAPTAQQQGLPSGRGNHDGHTKDGYGPARGIPCCTTNMLGYECGCASPAFLANRKRDPYLDDKRRDWTDAVTRSFTDQSAKNVAARKRLDSLASESPKPRRLHPKYDGTKWQEWPAGDERSEP